MPDITDLPLDQAFKDDFYYFNTAGAPVTTDETANMTIRISKSDSVVTSTGLALASIETAGGHFQLQGDTTAFIADVGYYSVLITHNSDALAKWKANYRVVSNYAYSDTGASFTATAGDGRVTDGTNPLASSSVWIQDSSGVTLTKMTTDASGLWGPVKGLVDSSYTIIVQKNSYTQDTAAITVSGTIATGPGADIELSASTSGSERLGSSLIACAKRMAGDRQGAKAEVMLLNIVNDAVDMVAKDSNSPWFLRRYDFTASAAYETGTVALTEDSTTVTLTSGTWPSWAASGILKVSNRLYWIDTRDSDTELTLETAWAESDVAAGTYTLFRASYDFPQNHLQTREIYIPAQRTWSILRYIPPEKYMQELLQWMQVNDQLDCWTVFDDMLYLTPSLKTKQVFHMLYVRRPTPITGGADTADFDEIQIGLVRRAIDLQVAQRFGVTSAGMDYNDCLRAYTQELELNTFNDRQQYVQHSPVRGFRSRHQDILAAAWNAPGS